MKTQRLLVSIRGPNEAISAVKGGALIADVEYPVSALGTPYPLNIAAVRARLNRRGFRHVQVSTNIGEVQSVRAAACQAAVGVAVAGADLVKFGSSLFCVGPVTGALPPNPRDFSLLCQPAGM